MVYKHSDSTRAHLSLHDCSATGASFENGVISFFFEDGFWILPSHPESDLDAPVRTDGAKADFYLERGIEEDVLIYVFTMKKRGKATRETMRLSQLIDDINSKKCRLEFLYQYDDHNSQLIKCWLWFERRPYDKECCIELQKTKEVYSWNDLRADCVW